MVIVILSNLVQFSQKSDQEQLKYENYTNFKISPVEAEISMNIENASYFGFYWPDFDKSHTKLLIR